MVHKQSVTPNVLTYSRQHRKIMKDLSLGVKYHGMSTENILSLLVESGFIYSFLWVENHPALLCRPFDRPFQGTQIIGYLDFVPDSPWNFISEIVVRIGRQITGMYPTLIIVIVNFKRTIWEEYPITTPGHGSNSLHWTVNSGGSPATRTETRPEVGIHLDTMHTDFGIHRHDKELANEEFGSQDRVVVL